MIKTAGFVVVLTSLLFIATGCSSVGPDPYFMIDTTASVYVSPQTDKITKIAILPFKGPTELIGSSVSDMFVTEMLKAGRYELVERSQMSKVLGETELSLAGLSSSKAVEAATMLGADGVIIGTVDEYEMKAYKGKTFPTCGMSVRMIDCQSGKIVWSVDYSERSDDASDTLSQHGRKSVHQITAGLYQKWIKQKGRKMVSSAE